MNPLYGLVLAGGMSRRMGFPKAAITYRGIPEASRMYILLGEMLERVYYGIGSSQEGTAPFRHGRVLIDRTEGAGPLAALDTAMAAHPEADWLAAPSDMPLLDRSDLELLTAVAANGGECVLFVNADGARFPLPAIYRASLAP